jgi:hypothetical protein
LKVETPGAKYVSADVVESTVELTLGVPTGIPERDKHAADRPPGGDISPKMMSCSEKV